MSMDSGAVFLPGRGTVFTADPGTTPFDYKTVDPRDPSTFEGWDCWGHTSRDNTVALSKDGGDSTQLGSWWDAAILDSRAPTSWSWTANSLQVDRTTMSMAFPGGEVRNGAYWVPSADRTIEKAAFILMEDGSGNRMGIYLPHTPLALGDAPEIDIENFFEVQIAGSILSDDTSGDRIGFFHPKFDTTGGGSGGSGPDD